MRIQHAARTDPGMKRKNNEDTFLLLVEDSLFAVFDGMGGHASGEVASDLAAETMAGFFDLTREDDSAPWPCEADPERSYDENRMLAAIKLANQRIVEAASADTLRKRMGTTVAALQF